MLAASSNTNLTPKQVEWCKTTTAIMKQKQNQNRRVHTAQNSRKTTPQLVLEQICYIYFEWALREEQNKSKTKLQRNFQFFGSLHAVKHTMQTANGCG